MPLPPIDPRAPLLAAQLVGLRDAFGAVPAPPEALPGWESLCALEYARAVHRFEAALRTARAAIEDAAALVSA